MSEYESQDRDAVQKVLRKLFNCINTEDSMC